MANIYTESFYRGQILTSITETDGLSSSFPVNVSQLPKLQNGLLTITPNTEREEIVEYTHTGIAGEAGVLTITKRGIKPDALALTIPGVDYADVTNHKYCFSHTIGDSIRGDINNLHINQIANFNPSTVATESVSGTSRLSTPAVNILDPIVVGDNDTRLIKPKEVSLYDSTTNIAEGTSTTISFNNVIGSLDMVSIPYNKITFTKDGVYQIDYNLLISMDNTNSNVEIIIRKNGTSIIYDNYYTGLKDITIGGTYTVPLNGTNIHSFVNGDYIEIRVFSHSTNVNVGSIFKVKELISL